MTLPLSPPLRHNLKPFAQDFFAGRSRVLLFCDSVLSTHGSTLNFGQKAFFDEFCAGGGLDILAFSQMLGNFDAFDTQYIRLLHAAAGTKPDTGADPLVPGANPQGLGLPLTGDVWDTTAEAQPYPDGAVPYRYTQRLGYTGDTADGQQIVTGRFHSTLVDMIARDLPIAITVKFWADPAYSLTTHARYELTACKFTTGIVPLGPSAIIDPTDATVAGIKSVTLAYGGTLDGLLVAGEGLAFELNTVDGEAEGTKIPPHVFSVTIHAIGADDATGIALYNASQSDFSVEEFASSDGDPVPGSTIGPRKGWILDSGIYELGVEPIGITDVVVALGENSDRKLGGVVFANESEYGTHFDIGGGHQISFAALLDRIREHYPNARILVIGYPYNPRQSGSWTNTTPSFRRYDLIAEAQWAEVRSRNSPVYGWGDLRQQLGTTLTDNAATYFQPDPDDAHWTAAGAVAVMQAIRSMLEDALNDPDPFDNDAFDAAPPKGGAR